MGTVRDMIHDHHTELAEQLAAHVDALEAALQPGASSAGPGPDPQALVAFLKGDLLPHAQGEERTLYPAIDPLVKEHGSPTATMRVDHQYIAGYVASLEETARALDTATPAERPVLLRRAARLALQLQALLQVHLEKEESVYLPLFERYLSPAEQQRILDGMHEGGDEGAHEGTGAADVQEETLDVRPLPPAQRHARIFALFDALPAGGSFVLVNDHDPKPLRYQLLAERPGQLEWEYLEAGPDVWRVRLGKALAAPPATTTAAQGAR